MECMVDGIPLPNTVWMKDGALLEVEQVTIISYCAYYCGYQFLVMDADIH